jgi:hypothetical protein
MQRDNDRRKDQGLSGHFLAYSQVLTEFLARIYFIDNPGSLRTIHEKACPA